MAKLVVVYTVRIPLDLGRAYNHFLEHYSSAVHVPQPGIETITYCIHFKFELYHTVTCMAANFEHVYVLKTKFLLHLQMRKCSICPVKWRPGEAKCKASLMSNMEHLLLVAAGLTSQRSSLRHL